MKPSYIFLADGFEEIEALTVVDVLRRAGVSINTVSINDTTAVTGAHGVTVVADCLYADVRDFNDADWLILPGGMPGSQNLADFVPLGKLLRAHAADGGHIAAICAAPALVLAPLGILNGKNATCYPDFAERCITYGVKMHDTPCVDDGNIVTASGPASALRFALTILQKGAGASVAQSVGQGMLFYPKQMNFYF